MKIKFCGATRTVTGSCFYIDTGEFKCLVDCGAFQGGDELERLNYEPFPFDPASLDAVFLTHAHYDHCGRIPLLVKQGFKGRIISTQPTRELARVVLLDSAKLQKEEGIDLTMWSDSAIRRFLNRVGEENVEDLFKLRIADATANPNSPFDPKEITELQKRISEVRAKDMALKVTDLAINGNDLEKMGVKPGPEMGKVLKSLLDMVLEDPLMNTKEKLLEAAKNML